MSVLPVLPPIWRRLARSLVHVFWLPQPDSARVRVVSTERPRTRADVARARTSLALARRSEPGATQNALALDALHALLCSVARADGATYSDLASTLHAGTGRVQSTLDSPADLHALERYGAVVARCLAPDDPGSFHRILALCEWTDALIDTRSPREIAIRMRLRGWWSPRGVLVGATVALATVVSVLLFAPRNLALGKPVTASSICGATPAAPMGKERPEDRLSRLVDGVTVEGALSRIEWAHGTYAACTEMEVHPWITVDLGADHAVDDVVVYNRSDCCWGTDDTPLSVQLSIDNRTFVTVATTERPFTDDFPWRASFARHRARYVRLFNPADAPKNLVLSEIEIHGR